MRLRLGKYRWALLTVLAALTLLAAACDDEERAPQTPAAAESPSPAVAFPVTLTDSNGKQVTFEAAPQRIVALAPSFAEVLFAIGAGDAVVAVDENTDFPPEVTAKTKLSGFEPSVEGIVALQPDLVIIIFDPGDLQQALEALGIPVLFLATPASLQGVFDQIDLLGRASGRTDQARDVIADMQARIDALTAKLGDVDQGPRVFHELDPMLFTVSDQDFVGDLYRLLKARNIAAGAGPFPQLSNEAVIAANPEVIILADEPAGVTPNSVKARPGWESIDAVKNDRIYLIDPDIASRPGPRLAEALEALASFLYPELFP